MSEFGAVVIIAYHPIMRVLTFERFGAYGLQYARSVAVIFVFVDLFVFVGMRFFASNEKNLR